MHTAEMVRSVTLVAQNQLRLLFNPLSKTYIALSMTRRTIVVAICCADHHAVWQKQRRKLLIIVLLLPLSCFSLAHLCNVQNVFPQRRKQQLRVEVVAKLLLSMVSQPILWDPLCLHQRAFVPKHQHFDRSIEGISIRIRLVSPTCDTPQRKYDSLSGEDCTETPATLNSQLCSYHLRQTMPIQVFGRL